MNWSHLIICSTRLTPFSRVRPWCWWRSWRSRPASRSCRWRAWSAWCWLGSANRCGSVVPVGLSRTGAAVGPHVRLPHGVHRLPPGKAIVEGVHGGGGPDVRHYHAPRMPGERGVVDKFWTFMWIFTWVWWSSMLVLHSQFHHRIWNKVLFISDLVLEQLFLPVTAVSMRRRRPIGHSFSQCWASARVAAYVRKSSLEKIPRGNSSLEKSSVFRFGWFQLSRILLGVILRSITPG